VVVDNSNHQAQKYRLAAMTHQPISLHEINFSQPDGYFFFQEQSDRVKQYLGKYFFKNKSNQYPDFIYSFRYSLEAKKIIANRTFEPESLKAPTVRLSHRGCDRGNESDRTSFATLRL
jgi:hypothetical protein